MASAKTAAHWSAASQPDCLLASLTFLQAFNADLVLTDYPFAAGEALADRLNLPRAAMTIIVPVSAHTA